LIKSPSQPAGTILLDFTGPAQPDRTTHILLSSYFARKATMIFFRWLWIVLLLLFSIVVYCQETTLTPDNKTQKLTQFYGFVRGGMYAGIDHEDDHKPYISSAFSDFALKVNIENGLNFKAFADIRFRYGVEFLEPVSRQDIREAYIKINGKKWDLSAGQQIVKWGRADFTNPTSRLSPQNYISRSPDREDMDMGNLISVINWFPAEFINFEAVAIPYYRSSVLIIDPIPLPENVTVIQITSLLTDRTMFSYGLKADIHLRGIDWSLSWFDGYDPMPGTALSGFNLDMSGGVPVPSTQLSMTPYKTRALGLDFETSAGAFSMRGEAVWTAPYLSYKTCEYVPLPEIKWVGGLDWSSGNWRITGEYSGKYIIDYIPSSVDPVIGSEPDFETLAQMVITPGFDLESYIQQQVGAFNRLYNYQLEEYYHTGGIRIEANLVYGKLTPSVFTMYNFTSRDLLIIPEMKLKPSDGLTITAGAELYNGINGSLYDIVDGFMNSIYLALKVDF
jgi:hypothetical protein